MLVKKIPASRVVTMLNYLKKLVPNRHKTVAQIIHLAGPNPTSSEHRYLVESLKLRGYFPKENIFLSEGLRVDLFLEKEKVAIVLFDPSTITPFEKCQHVTLKKQLRQYGCHLILFNRLSFYKSLRIVFFQLRQYRITP